MSSLNLYQKLLLYYANEDTYEKKLREDNNLLLLACKSSSTKIAKQLIKIAPIEILNKIDEEGYSALLYACKNKMYKIASQLLKNNLDVNIKSNIGETALEICIKNKMSYELYDRINHSLIFSDYDIILDILRKDINTLKHIDINNNNCLMLLSINAGFGIFINNKILLPLGIFHYLSSIEYYPVNPLFTNKQGVCEFMYIINI